MKIDPTRYRMFWQNPERYRMREARKLSPVEPKAGTFASLLSYGRRRGTCYHEFRDGDYRQVPTAEVAESLRSGGGFEEKEIEAGSRMAAAVKARYGDWKVLANEMEFEYPIPDSPHSIVGRIDHIIDRGDNFVFIGDYKTSKPRTKKEMNRKIDEYAADCQVDAYYLGARQKRFDPHGFLFRIIVDHGPDKPVEIIERETGRTGLELKQFARGVAMTCDLIEYLTKTYGTERPWPHLPNWPCLGDKTFCGFKNECCKYQATGYIPEGFQPAIEHLAILRDGGNADALQA